MAVDNFGHIGIEGDLVLKQFNAMQVTSDKATSNPLSCSECRADPAS